MTEMNSLIWCTNCLAMSTRPRITFDRLGKCNACVWMEKKKSLNWNNRQQELEQLLDKHRRNDGGYEVVVPVSGGKDGSYVAYNLKHKYGMKVLALTVTPALSLEIGDQNLKAFIASGYNHISINPDFKVMQTLNKTGYIEMGFPYYGWLIAIQSAVVRMTSQLGINLIFYGEDGEVEYGGTNETSKDPIFDVNYMKKIYLENGYDKVLKSSGLSENELFFFQFPSNETLERSPIDITHWSYFENWDPYRNYLSAKEHCGLVEAQDSNSGTFTNFSQNDQALYSLHAYLMYLKFGFGRATQDACIEIRRGAMNRKQALNLVHLYDGQYPDIYLKYYLDYYQLTKSEFDVVLDSWANTNLFEKVNGNWKPLFKVN